MISDKYIIRREPLSVQYAYTSFLKVHYQATVKHNRVYASASLNGELLCSDVSIVKNMHDVDRIVCEHIGEIDWMHTATISALRENSTRGWLKSTYKRILELICINRSFMTDIGLVSLSLKHTSDLIAIICIEQTPIFDLNINPDYPINTLVGTVTRIIQDIQNITKMDPEEIEELLLEEGHPLMDLIIFIYRGEEP